MMSSGQNAVNTLAQTASTAKRLLLIKFGAIGDVVMAIPAAAAMHRAGYSVDWVASRQVAPVLELYPWIHVLPVDEPRLLRGSLVDRASGIWAMWRTLRSRISRFGPYDTVTTLYYDPRYRLLSLPISARRKILLSREDRRFTLLAGRHHTDEYARILCDWPDGERPGQLAPVPVPGLPKPSRPLLPGRTRIVLVPAGARNVLRDDALRRWPMDHYVTLAELLVSAGYEVVLAGGPEDRWASAAFAGLAAQAGPDRLADLIGALSLVETLALLDSAAVTVTHDTGPLHLAGLTSTAILTIFGPTDPHGRLPQREGAVAIWGGEGFACRPCYDSRDYAACTQNGCMAQVDAAMVFAEVERLVENRKRAVPMPPRVITPDRRPLVQITTPEQGGGLL